MGQPNGISDETQKERAKLDRRFWLSDKLHHVSHDLTSAVDTINAEDVSKVTDEFKPFTDDELAKRRSYITQFWTVLHLPSYDLRDFTLQYLATT